MSTPTIEREDVRDREKVRVEEEPLGGAETPRNGAGPQTPPSGRKSSKLRRIVLPILGALVLGAIAIGFNIWWQDAHYVSTDNAQVGGTPVPVGSMNAGRVSSIRAVVGAQVHQGDVLAQVELPTAVKTNQNGSPDLQFLGTADQFLDITAPINGVVIAVPAAVGATVAQGQAIVTLVDPTKLWVTANVDENKVPRLQLGQLADVHLDATGETVQGTVTELTPATAGVFSLLPQSNTTTNFTKVGQVVPVRIGVALGSRAGLLGSSAEVKIHVA
ncbi:MAG TPA: efflux RND transporter periplasmic adaptor subunit [Chloroflexota bacterium]|nr:efflux RND transporter periplasmic adaptor subunit [Chloroflexota bacterium]